MNIQYNEEDKEQIEQAAETYAGISLWINKNQIEQDHEFHEYIAKQSYIQGAEDMKAIAARDIKFLEAIIEVNKDKVWTDADLINVYNLGAMNYCQSPMGIETFLNDVRNKGHKWLENYKK